MNVHVIIHSVFQLRSLYAKIMILKSGERPASKSAIEQNINFVQLRRRKKPTEANRLDLMYYIVFKEKCKAAQGS